MEKLKKKKEDKKNFAYHRTPKESQNIQLHDR